MPLPESFASLRESIAGSPNGLMVICGLQAVILLFSIFFGNQDAECEIVLPPGGDIELNCEHCRVLGGVTWRDFFFLFIGLAIIGVGFVGAFRRDKELCRIYATIMTVYAFIIGLTATLTWLQAPVLEAAVEAVPEENADCRSIGDMMVANTRWHAFLFGLGAVLDAFGAIFAMQSVEYFDYEEIRTYHDGPYQNSHF